MIRIQVFITETQKRELDEIRGDTNRSEMIRRILDEKLNKQRKEVNDDNN